MAKKINTKPSKCYWVNDDEGNPVLIPGLMGAAVYNWQECRCCMESEDDLINREPGFYKYNNLTVEKLVEAYENVIGRLEK